MAEEEQGRLIDVIRRIIITTKEEYIATEIPIQGLSCEGCTGLLLAYEINIMTRIDNVV
jgi:hypothetical protein